MNDKKNKDSKTNRTVTKFQTNNYMFLLVQATLKYRGSSMVAIN